MQAIMLQLAVGNAFAPCKAPHPIPHLLACYIHRTTCYTHHARSELWLYTKGGGGFKIKRHAGSIALLWGTFQKTAGFWSKLVLLFRCLNSKGGFE